MSGDNPLLEGYFPWRHDIYRRPLAAKSLDWLVFCVFCLESLGSELVLWSSWPFLHWLNFWWDMERPLVKSDTLTSVIKLVSKGSAWCRKGGHSIAISVFEIFEYITLEHIWEYLRHNLAVLLSFSRGHQWERPEVVVSFDKRQAVCACFVFVRSLRMSFSPLCLSFLSAQV